MSSLNLFTNIYEDYIHIVNALCHIILEDVEYTNACNYDVGCSWQVFWGWLYEVKVEIGKNQGRWTKID